MVLGKSGRPRDQFTYDQFTDPSKPTGKRTLLSGCEHCGQKVSYQIKRLRNHLSTCNRFRTETEPAEYTKFMVERDFATVSDLVGMYGPSYALPAIPGTGTGSGCASTVSGTSFASSWSSSSSNSSAIDLVGSPSQPLMRTFMQPALSKADKQSIDYHIAQFAHLEGHSLTPFKNDSGQALLKKLRPGYIDAGGPPSSEDVSGKLLAKHNNGIMGKVYDALTGTTSVGICTDGWTDANSSGLHNFMACNPVPYLLGSVRCPDETEEASKLYEMAIQFAKEIRDVFARKSKPAPLLIGFCTDSPNGNKGMRVKLAAEPVAQGMNIIPYGCVCHGLNNFGKDTFSKFPLLDKTLEQGKVVATVFRNVKFAKFHLNAVQLAQRGKTGQILMPVDTRWNSNWSMLKSLLRNKEELMFVTMKSAHGDLNPALDLSDQFSGTNTAGLDGSKVSVAALIGDKEFWERLALCETLVKPIASLVTYLEGDMAPLSMLAAAFIKLLRSYKVLAELPDDDLFPFAAVGLKPEHFKDTKVHTGKTLPDLLRRRWGEITAGAVNPTVPATVSSLLHLALYLDHGTRGLVSAAMQDSISIDKARSLGDAIAAGASHLSKILLEDGRYQSLTTALAEAETATRAQLMAGLETEDQATSVTADTARHPLNFHSFGYGAENVMAKALFPLMTSAAGGERSFSVYGATHTKKRNRLGAHVLDSLARVKVNTKQLIRKTVFMTPEVRDVATLRYFYSKNYKATLGTVDTLMYDIATLEQDAPDPATVDAVNDDVDENLDVVTVDDKESDDSDDDESESDDE
jgi:hypothetical protein